MLEINRKVFYPKNVSNKKVLIQNNIKTMFFFCISLLVAGSF